MSSPWPSRQGGRGALAALALAAALVAGVAAAGTNERVIADRRSGVAIWGYDPVAYFLDGAARAGSPAHEATHAGLVWRFQNDGNRAAFLEQPGVYTPVLGGHDPTSAARGIAVPGNPEVFAMHGGRLYFFRDEASRERFFSDPATAAKGAEVGWPEAAKTLAR